MFFLISVTVAAAAINSEVKSKSSKNKNESSKHKKESSKHKHVVKKVKKEVDPNIAVDPDIAAGKTELTPLQANKYNLGDYAGSSTTIDTPDGASNTINMGVNAGIQFDDGPYPGNKILEGDHAGTTFNFGNYPGITLNDAPKHGFSGITTISNKTFYKPTTLYSSEGYANRQAPVQNAGKYVNFTGLNGIPAFNNTTIV